MGETRSFNPVKLFTGLIFNAAADKDRVVNEMAQMYSEPDLLSDVMVFNFTDYYSDEMGGPLFRQFVSFGELVDPLKLPDIKNRTNRIENELTASGKRNINIDPGYLSDANVIIATTKNYFHRIPLADGIYAHMEYVIIGKTLTFLDWTYPDFRSEAYLNFFRELLDLYKRNMKQRKMNR